MKLLKFYDKKRVGVLKKKASLYKTSAKQKSKDGRNQKKREARTKTMITSVDLSQSEERIQKKRRRNYSSGKDREIMLKAVDGWQMKKLIQRLGLQGW